MTANQSRLLGVALLLAAIAGFVQLARLNEPADGAADRGLAQDVLARKHEAEQELARSRARLEAGAFVLRRKHLSDSEDIEVIVIPEGLADALDTRCIVYRNSELRTSSIACSGIYFPPAAPPS